MRKVVLFNSGRSNYAGKMNSLPKLVFSRTREKAEWSNTRLVKGSAAQEITKSNNRAENYVHFRQLELSGLIIPHGLIDEFRIIVNPVVLGGGKPCSKAYLKGCH